MKKPSWNLREEPDELIFAAVQRFLSELEKRQQGTREKHGSTAAGGGGSERGRTSQKARALGPAAAVAQWLREEMKRPGASRQQIYPLLSESFRRGLLVLKAPPAIALANNLIFKFGFDQPAKDADDLAPIQVIDAFGSEAPGHVASAGADLVHRLIHRLGKKRRVHLGIGPGLSAKRLCERLAELIAVDESCPKLKIHALSSGGLTLDDASIAPMGFFHVFGRAHPDVKFTGLFTEAIVECERHEQVVRNPSVRLAFDQRDEIDIVVTTMNAAITKEGEPHHCGILAKYLDSWDGETNETRNALQKAGWVGDVQFLPYSDRGPIAQKVGIRTVSLFKLEELVAWAKRPDKYVVLVVGPCRKCGIDRAHALWPLVVNPELRVWSHLVTDRRTAQVLLRMPRDLPKKPKLSKKSR